MNLAEKYISIGQKLLEICYKMRSITAYRGIIQIVESMLDDIRLNNEQYATTFMLYIRNPILTHYLTKFGKEYSTIGKMRLK